MEWTRLLGLCVLAAALTMILQQMNAPAAALLAAAFGVMALFSVLPQIGRYAQEIRSLLQRIGLEETYYRIILKVMGIALITQITAGICTDMGASSAAKHAEMCGRLALMGVAVPVFVQLTEMAVGVLSP